MQFRPKDGTETESRTFIYGLVRDGDGAPARDITVSLDGPPHFWTRTDASGAFNLRSPESGTIALRLLRADGSSKRVSVDVPGPAIELDLD